MISLRQLLKSVLEQKATDLHIVAGSPPVLRINGQMTRIKYDALDAEDTKKICYSILTDEQKAKFEETKELDFSFGIQKSTRFRVNLFLQRGAISGAFRRIPYEIPAHTDLGLPRVVGEFTRKSNGLILVTGPTGSGKSTTIASLIDKYNSENYGHIITIEDPIEYIHSHKRSVVNQRELGPDTWSFGGALKYVLRQDPDVVLIGEMRDLETIESALRIAETGHLVFATLHTNSAAQTINRIVTVFPSDQQERIRQNLSFVLQGIMSQQLLPGIKGSLQLASEVLIPTPGVRNLIRENKIHQIHSQMQMGQERTGMQTMNQSLMSLLLHRSIEMTTAFEASPDPDELDKLLKKAGL
jgi:twitching motility protein PilT